LLFDGEHFVILPNGFAGWSFPAILDLDKTLVLLKIKTNVRSFTEDT
jgi:hypothetical protein